MAKNRDLSKLANRLTVDNNYNVGISGSLTVTGSIISTVSTLWSGSAQLPSGVVSGSAQTIAHLPSGTVSGSAQTIANLPSGVVSGSAQTIANLPSGTVSGSAQVDVMSTTNIARLATTGSNTFQGNQTINGSLVVTGSLTAQQFIVSSSVTYLTESFASGSHKFGDSSDDTHQFTGSILLNGNATVSGSITMTTNTNASSPIWVSNTNAGTAAYSGIHIGNNRSANGGGVVLTSTGYTSGNVILSADSTYIYNNGTGGIGISSEQSGPIKFGTGGVLAMTISSTQQVAIGAQTPLSKLHVNTTSNTDGIYLYNNVSGNQQTLLLVGSSSVGSFIAGNTKPDGTAIQSGDFAGRIILQGGPTDGIQLQTSAVSSGVAHSWSTRLFVYHNGNVVMSGTGALTIPKGTTGERPTAVSGMVRFNTSVGLPEVYTGTDWIYMSALNGSSAETAAPSASVIKALNPAAPNGVYWLKFASGSNTAFQAYIIFDKPDGPWVKAVQWYNTTDLSGSAGVNAGGSWTSSQIGLSAGKIPSADINILKASLTTLWRVTGSADSLMNYGAGALKIIWSYLPNWGTDAQPTTSQPYDIYVDAANDGTWDYGYRYVPTQQSRCNHTTSIWISDHDSPVGSGSTLLLGTKTSSADYPICWTVGASSWYTNLHPWTGNSAASGGNVQWGTASTAAALYFKN